MLQDHVFQLIKPFRDFKTIWQIRIEASRALLDLEFHCKGMDAALSLFITYLEEEPSLRGSALFLMGKSFLVLSLVLLILIMTLCFICCFYKESSLLGCRADKTCCTCHAVMSDTRWIWFWRCYQVYNSLGFDSSTWRSYRIQQYYSSASLVLHFTNPFRKVGTNFFLSKLWFVSHRHHYIIGYPA